eukprot:GDKH01000632.1.p1 GENE.GDKH01000632.1~~GDKH01000632.1.p1  ORF type:complete len:249 (-),score=0.74 GDKH01000632.1:143-889(-)
MASTSPSLLAVEPLHPVLTAMPTGGRDTPNEICQQFKLFLAHKLQGTKPAPYWGRLEACVVSDANGSLEAACKCTTCDTTYPLQANFEKRNFSEWAKHHYTFGYTGIGASHCCKKPSSTRVPKKEPSVVDESTEQKNPPKRRMTEPKRSVKRPKLGTDDARPSGPTEDQKRRCMEHLTEFFATANIPVSAVEDKNLIASFAVVGVLLPSAAAMRRRIDEYETRLPNKNVLPEEELAVPSAVTAVTPVA